MFGCQSCTKTTAVLNFNVLGVLDQDTHTHTHTHTHTDNSGENSRNEKQNYVLCVSMCYLWHTLMATQGDQ